jgi:hypothetical protein
MPTGKGRNVKAKTVLCRLLVIGLIATLFSFGSVNPASAATGGGCNSYYGLYGTYRPCISAPSYGTVRPDFYLWLHANHPTCAFTLYVVKSGGGTISHVTYNCPSGAVSGKHYSAIGFQAYSGSYATVVVTTIGTLDCSRGCRSPYITMP